MTYSIGKRALASAVMVASLLGATMSARAGDPPPNPAAASNSSTTQAKKPDPMDRVICREEEVTGSRLGGKRICHTKREWDQLSEDARRNLDGNQVAGSGGPK